MSLYKYGKFEIEIDQTDVAFVEKYESAAEAYEKEMNAVRKDGKASEIFSAMCNVFFDMFDQIFGEGTHKLMFGEKRSVDACANALGQLVSVMNDYTGTLNNISSITPGNRAQRRAKK